MSLLMALSVKQPWAWAIISSGKDVENRTWQTKMRGRVAIHASARVSQSDYDDALWLGVYASPDSPIDWPAIDSLAKGAIIGTVEIVACVRQHHSRWFQHGGYGFVLRNPIALPEPIPCRGALGFWAVPEEIAQRISQTIPQEGI